MTFADDATPLSPRMLAPATATAIILLAAWIGRSHRRSLTLLCLLWALPQAARSLHWAESAHSNGIHYQKTALLDSRVVRPVADFGECVEVYSNYPKAVRWHAGRHGRHFSTLQLNNIPEQIALVWFFGEIGDEVAATDPDIYLQGEEVAVWRNGARDGQHYRYREGSKLQNT